MKISRLSASVAAFAAIGLLAACGGGGGGGTPPVNNNPGGPPPPTATSSPTQSPTSTPPPTPTPPPSTQSIPGSGILLAYDGVAGSTSHVNGIDGWQTNGVTVSGDAADGDTASGGNCSAAMGGVGCDLNNESQMTSSNYHVHVFLGIWANGKEYAIPDGIGMENAVDTGKAIGSFTAAYDIHTHDASGIIHVEDPNQNGTYTKVSASTLPQFNLQTLFDIWGVTYSGSGFANFSGQTAIYTNTPSTKNPQTGDELVTSYNLYTGQPSSLLLAHHTAIWIVIGTPPSTLPQVDFGISS